MHDSDPNAAKTCFVHVKSGGGGLEGIFLAPHFKKWGSIDPPRLRASAVYDSDECKLRKHSFCAGNGN